MYPHEGWPNASLTHTTHPAHSGKALESSAVSKASGILHTKGKTMYPTMPSKGPTFATMLSMPKGPPEEV